MRLLTQKYAQFWSFGKWSGNSFSTIFCVWFLKKMFLMLYSVSWPNFFVGLPLLLEILGNMYFFPGCHVINFEINLISLIKPFFFLIRKSRKSLIILRTSFKMKQKSFFIIFKELSFVTSCLSPKSVPLITRRSNVIGNKVK